MSVNGFIKGMLHSTIVLNFIFWGSICFTKVLANVRVFLLVCLCKSRFQRHFQPRPIQVLKSDVGACPSNSLLLIN